MLIMSYKVLFLVSKTRFSVLKLNNFDKSVFFLAIKFVSINILYIYIVDNKLNKHKLIILNNLILEVYGP